MKKNPHAVALGRLGGRQRAENLTPVQRRKIASNAGKTRTKKLSAEERRRIAMLGVAARRKKRKESQ